MVYITIPRSRKVGIMRNTGPKQDWNPAEKTWNPVVLCLVLKDLDVCPSSFAACQHPILSMVGSTSSCTSPWKTIPQFWLLQHLGVSTANPSFTFRFPWKLLSAFVRDCHHDWVLNRKISVPNSEFREENTNTLNKWDRAFLTINSFLLRYVLKDSILEGIILFLKNI